MATNPSPGDPKALAQLRASLAAAEQRIAALEQQLQQQEERRSLAVLQERSRLAEEIHDGIAQKLALLLLKMEILSRLADSDPPKMKVELRKVAAILESTVGDARASVASLQPHA